MPRLIQPTYTPGPRHPLAAIGDSLTHNSTLGVLPHAFWPEVLSERLRGLGAGVIARNFGRSGNTSQDMIARFGHMTRYDVPKVGIIWAGANDPGNAIVGATTQANIQSMAETLFSAGTRFVIIGNTQYLNWSTGGDTVSAQSTTYATLKGFQQAAAAALATAHPGQAAYCDTYAAMRQKIVAGVETQGSNSWHTSANNQHLNALGERYVAEAMLATIQAQPGWLDALKAG